MIDSMVLGGLLLTFEWLIPVGRGVMVLGMYY